MGGLLGLIGNGISQIVMAAANATAADTGSSAAFAGMLGMMAVFWILIMAFYLAIIVIALAFFVIWIFMIVDCVRRNDFPGENDKLLWVLILILGGWIGAIVYYFVVMKKKP